MAKKMRQPKKSLLIEADGTTHKILTDKIIYIEAFSHIATINTTTGQYAAGRNIGQIAKYRADRKRVR